MRLKSVKCAAYPRATTKRIGSTVARVVDSYRYASVTTGRYVNLRTVKFYREKQSSPSAPQCKEKAFGADMLTESLDKATRTL